MAGSSGTPTQGNTGSNVFAVPTQMQNQQMGTLLSTTPQTTTPTTQPSTLPNQQQNTSDITNMLAGGKGGGMMKPQQTAMGTPIIYGNTYLPQSQTVANTPVPAVDTNTNYGNYDGGFADGTMSVPGYAYGTKSVAGYARGTMGVDEDDPWNWTQAQQVAPLAATIKPSEAVIPQAVPDPTEQYLGQQATAIGTNAAAKGIDAAYKAYNAPLTTNAITSMGTTASNAPVALTNVGAMTAPAASAMPTAVGAMTAPISASLAPASGLGFSTGAGGAATGLVAPASSVIPTVIGAGGTAAPLGSALAGLSTGAAVAPVATTAGAAATPIGLAGAGAMGGEAMLAALGPVGMVIGGALLAKKLGII
jgi:hypothetical protein